MYYLKKSIFNIQRKPGIVTERRRRNFHKAFNWINWNWETLRIIKMGFGDKPAFSVDGIYRGIEVLYISPYPSGSYPGKIKFYFPNKKRLMFTSKASLRDADEIRVKVDVIINNFKIKEDIPKLISSLKIFNYDVYDILTNKTEYNQKIMAKSRLEFLEKINDWNRIQMGDTVYIAKGEGE